MKKSKLGFTLIEMLLVLVIISMIIFAFIGYTQRQAESARIDRTTMQMQQILNAGLAYYVDHGAWPPQSTTTDPLAPLKPTYLPDIPIINPWNQGYSFATGTATFNSRNFIVWSTIPAPTTTPARATAIAAVISGLLPLAYTSSDVNGTPPDSTTPCDGNGDCAIVAQVNIPGQNLNNASAVNFMGMYHHGACIPVPSCPQDPRTGVRMRAQVMVFPVGVAGVNDYHLTDQKVYPIGSFMAYTMDPAANPDHCIGSDPLMTPNCTNRQEYNTNRVSSYWRACLKLVTEKGDVQSSRTDIYWAQTAYLVALTRCAITDEPAGSTLEVFGQ